jgi:ATP adenylyltransferase
MTTNTKIQPKHPTTFIDLKNARYDDQRKVMKKILDANHCPFCLENLRKYHKQPIMIEGKYWIVTPNQWPYAHTKVHMLMIYKEHAETLDQIPSGAGDELIQLSTQLCEKYQVEGGGLAMRFGDTRYSAGSVKHLHLQFIVPDLSSPNFKPVKVKIGREVE